jgi:hypothetical protein
MWSDNETDVDLLQFKYLASSVTRIIRAKHLLPTTIGVFGDWGSGKSSLLKMVQKDLAEDPGIMTISFNGWLFEGFEDAKTALMGTILDEIQERIKDDKNIAQKARDLLGKLAKRVNWFHLIGLTGRYALPALVGMPHLTAAAVGMDTVKAVVEKAKGVDIEEAKKLLKDSPDGEENVRRNIRDFRKDFEDLLKESKIETMVVFIDDLDRCFPDTIIETLEAIKLFLFVPGTAFVLGADERLIEYAVRRFPELPGTNAEVGRDYLEKLVQNPVRIPPLSGAENHSYINLLFAQGNLDAADFATVCESVASFKPNNVSDLSFDIETCRRLLTAEKIPQQLEHDLDLTAQIAPVLTPGLGGNPRRTKRFLNTLLLRMEMAADRGLDLRRQVLAKLMLLEYLKPEFFKHLARIQAAQEGKPNQLAETERTLRWQPSEDTEEVVNEIAAASDDRRRTEDVNSGRKARKPKSASDEKPQAISEETLPAEIQPWLADSLMRNWLSSEPLLSAVDLRPYFYIAHDTIGPLEATQTRLSPAARTALDKLLDSGGVSQGIGLKLAEQLNAPDATAVFESLAQRIRQAESLDQSPQKVLFDLMQHRPSLVPQLVTFYSSLPEPKLTLATTTMLYEVTKDTPSAPATEQLLERWARSSRPTLANAAKGVLLRAKNRSSRTEPRAK